MIGAAEGHIGARSVLGDDEVDRRHHFLAHALGEELYRRRDFEARKIDDIDDAPDLARYPQLLAVRRQRKAPGTGVDDDRFDLGAGIDIDDMDEARRFRGNEGALAVGRDQHAFRFFAGRVMRDDFSRIGIEHARFRIALVGNVEMPAVGRQSEGFRVGNAAIAPQKLEGRDIVEGDRVVVAACDIDGRAIGIELDPARTGAGVVRRDDCIGAVEHGQGAALLRCNEGEPGPLRIARWRPSEQGRSREHYRDRCSRRHEFLSPHVISSCLKSGRRP